LNVSLAAFNSFHEKFCTLSAMPVKNTKANLKREILEIAQLLKQCQQTPDAVISPAKFSFGASVPGA